MPKKLVPSDYCTCVYAVKGLFSDRPKSLGRVDKSDCPYHGIAKVKAKVDSTSANNRSDEIAWCQEAFNAIIDKQSSQIECEIWDKRKSAVIAQLRTVR